MIRLALADDHQSLLDGIQLHLKNEADIRFVGSANDGEALLDLVRLKQPNVVITDIRMPILDGIQATRQIKEEFPSIKILALTMYDQGEAVKKMLQAGADGYILKNATLEEVLSAVRCVFNGKTYYDTQINVPNLNATLPNTNPKNEKRLTRRQSQILQLIAQGKTSLEIADELFIGVYTVDTHRKNMARILGLKGKGELLRYALDKKYKF